MPDTTPPHLPVTRALICPRDRQPLAAAGDTLRCGHCGTAYPIVNGIPVLINDANSVFAVGDYAAASGFHGASYGRHWEQATGFRAWGRRLVRRLADSPTSMGYISDAEAIRQVQAAVAIPKVLVIGSGGRAHDTAGVEITNTDVAFGPGVDYIADAHDLPFPDGTFDLIIAIAVLEHVADPQRCVREFERVLGPAGFVYAVTPFLQPVHMGAYDFTRFTPLGHRRLFRHFSVIDAGPALGVGSVLAWSLMSFMKSLPIGRVLRNLAVNGSLIFMPLLKRLDRHMSAPAHLDATGGSYFFGRKAATPVSDRELIREYRGGFRTPE